MVTRFAPSPTGRLHLGHAFAAKVAFNFVKNQRFNCLLRIEDIDHTRCTNEYTLGIYRDLDWLGIDWPVPVKIQSKHYYDYAKAIKNLCDLGLAYECSLTRGNIRDGLLPKNKGISIEGYLDNFKRSNNRPNITHSIRLDLKKSMQFLKDQKLTFIETSSGTEKEINSKMALMDSIINKKPDPIIARKDIGVSYHIAVTHDDHYQNISHVVRGYDLYESTHLHVLIQKLSNWQTPKYHHHPVLNDKYGDKLSKRGLDTSIRSLRNNGLTAKQVLDMATL